MGPIRYCSTSPSDVDGYDYEPSWAPDGSAIAFTRDHRFVCRSCPKELRIIASTGVSIASSLVRDRDESQLAATVISPTLLLVTTLAIQASSSDSLRASALSLPESSLIAAIRQRPTLARDAVADALRESVRGPAPVRGEALSAALSLANGYAIAWQDSFLIRQVSRFAAWPPRTQEDKLWVDSLRRAGIAAYGQRGTRDLTQDLASRSDPRNRDERHGQHGSPLGQHRGRPPRPRSARQRRDPP
jgi:hypothetical protein